VTVPPHPGVDEARTPSPPTRPVALVVDDEPHVRAMLARVLAAFGFTVLAAGSGQEALALADAHAGPILLLVTDVEMPGLDGAELAAAMHARRPETAVLYISGRVSPRAVADAMRGRTAAFLAKPFALDELRRAIEALVGPLPAPVARP
jgi:two-component system cell cycle sensor histidine kinase/response regulator CckA